MVSAAVGIIATFAITTSATATPASAGLLSTTTGLVGGVLGTTTGVVGGLLGVVTSGWDDGVTTPPTPMSDVVKAVNADDMWARGYDGSGVGVAVIDSGVVPVEGLSGAGKVVNGPDLSFESQSDEYRYLDTFGHGTHMAGITAGRDSSGFKGVAPGAHIVSLKVATREGATDVSQILAAIDWVIQHRNDPGMNIRVLNLSYGTDSLQDHEVDPLAYAVEAAWRNGIVVVTSGGNDGAAHPSLTNPATDPYVLAVGAVDLQGTVGSADDTVAPFSSRGNAERSVDLVAPGVSIAGLRNPGSTLDSEHPGAVVDSRFFRGSGTSQAAAVVSGAAALLLDARPNLTPDKVKALLKSTATPLVETNVRAQGAGRIDVYRAANAAVPLIYGQSWPKAQGTGSLEQARGTSHVADQGVELVGEQDIHGLPWQGATWAPRSLAGTAWTGGSWNGSDWTGACWCTQTWSGASWTGRSWAGRSWAGRSWASDTWAGRSWAGRSWAGEAWTGRSWAGGSWTGRSWASG